MESPKPSQSSTNTKKCLLEKKSITPRGLSFRLATGLAFFCHPIMPPHSHPFIPPKPAQRGDSTRPAQAQVPKGLAVCRQDHLVGCLGGRGRAGPVTVCLHILDPRPYRPSSTCVSFSSKRLCGQLCKEHGAPIRKGSSAKRPHVVCRRSRGGHLSACQRVRADATSGPCHRWLPED